MGQLTINTRLSRGKTSPGTKEKSKYSTITEEESEEDEIKSRRTDNDPITDDEVFDEIEDDGSSFTSSPSIPDANIDFSLVYTLHTFVAAVEGQASVVKGDSLKLLDDSNSYWWLIKVLKTSEIGYIPAENIETPFERLARLNKHRNMEMSNVMDTVHSKKENKKKRPRTTTNDRKRVGFEKRIRVQSQVFLIAEDENKTKDTVDGASNEGDASSDIQGEVEDEVREEWQESLIGSIDGHDGEAMNAPIQEIRREKDHVEAHGRSGDATRNGQDHPPGLGPGLSHRQGKRTSFLRSLLFLHTTDKNKHRASQPDRASLTSIGSGASTRGSTLSSASSQNSHASAALGPTGVSEDEGEVIRVYAGNINVGTNYISVLVKNATTADELIDVAIERFHVPMTHHSQQGIEYYLTVQSSRRRGEEITLASLDRPLPMIQSLSDHLTTPMPSLSHVRELMTPTSVESGRLARQRAARFNHESPVRFTLHKRIRRTNIQNGEVHVKVSLIQTSAPSTPLEISFTLRRTKKPSEVERIDKLVAVPKKMTTTDFYRLVLEKFHLGNTEERYSVFVISQDSRRQRSKESLLPPGRLLADYLGSEHPHFILRPSRRPQQRPVMALRPRAKHKVSPRTFDAPMSLLDRQAQSTLNRLDQVLTHHAGPQSEPASIGVTRNAYHGIDLVLPHGVLRTVPLQNQRTQYTLMSPTAGVVMQRIVPVDRDLVGISDSEIASLVYRGTALLEAQENDKADPTNGLFIADHSTISSLGELERELGRIAASYSTA